MILSHLFLHWDHRRKSYHLLSLGLSILRSSRVLIFFSEHCKLCQLDNYRNYVARTVPHDLFHHLNHRYYLAKHLSVQQRIQCAISHYHFENITFSDAYKQLVYFEQGLPLWTKTVDENLFSIELSIGDRTIPEGDLCIALLVNKRTLHKINFSWVKGHILQLDSHILPFIGRTQGSGHNDPPARVWFDRSFPQNSPLFFCFSALQGLAQAIGATEIFGISSHNQVGFDLNDTTHFINTYDAFWESLGGKKTSELGYSIPVPFHMKPISEISSKHRKRAVARRKYWKEIDDSARMTLETYMRKPLDIQKLH